MTSFSFLGIFCPAVPQDFIVQSNVFKFSVKVFASVVLALTKVGKTFAAAAVFAVQLDGVVDRAAVGRSNRAKVSTERRKKGEKKEERESR